MKKGLFNFLWTGFGTVTTTLRGIGMALAYISGVLLSFIMVTLELLG